MKALESLASHAYSRIADAQQSTGNEVALLKDGAENYPAWLAAIAAATKSVALENYIIEESAIGGQFASALIAAAERGANVRIIYDWLGCLTRTSQKFWAQLSHPNIEWRAYNPPALTNPIRIISRDHRKVLVIDGIIAFTGGLCIGHDWTGGPDPKKPGKILPPWRDTAVQITGPAVTFIATAFEDSWNAANPHTTPTSKAPPTINPPAAKTGLDVSVIAGRPSAMRLYRLEQLVAEIVEQKLWLTDGYFVATTAYVQALTTAAKAGIDIRLILPGSSNWPVVGALSQTSFRPLLTAGVRIFEWNGPMVHAKTAVADGVWSRIGSSNSNLASWVSNRELDITVTDANFASQMETMFEADMENCTEVLLQPGLSGRPRPTTSRSKTLSRPTKNHAIRFAAGAIGIGSTLRATFTRTRTLGPGEGFVLAGAAAGALSIALIALIFPKALAWPIALIATWTAIALTINATKLLTSRPQK